MTDGFGKHVGEPLRGSQISRLGETRLRGLDVFGDHYPGLFMRMIDFSAIRFLTMSCDIVGKCRLLFITRRVSEGFTEYPSLTRRGMDHSG
ncbi:hypothetical protein Pla52n_49540 [Stieleria varia]|uniref:Uncharacterized protein n=1 Tax=Stieleria varia TaxID=2528005 RepID=A0A5C6AG46_9BACT|nr:hypothetical protein Pla52n_49540 [Stieleria varia]